MSSLRISHVVALSAALAVSVGATTHDHPRISMHQARATAMARVHGKVRSAELEREGGRLIYSFDIARPGKSGIEEVHVDAMKGNVLSVSHEGPKTEKKEARAEKR